MRKSDCHQRLGARDLGILVQVIHLVVRHVDLVLPCGLALDGQYSAPAACDDVGTRKRHGSAARHANRCKASVMQEVDQLPLVVAAPALVAQEAHIGFEVEARGRTEIY